MVHRNSVHIYIRLPPIVLFQFTHFKTKQKIKQKQKLHGLFIKDYRCYLRQNIGILYEKLLLLTVRKKCEKSLITFFVRYNKLKQLESQL